MTTGARRRLPIWRMVEIAANHFGMTSEQLRSPCRQQRYFVPRAAIALVAAELSYVTTTIARSLGRKDHSSAINAIRRGRYVFDRDADFAAFVWDLRSIAEAYTVFGDYACQVWFEVAKAAMPTPAVQFVEIEIEDCPEVGFDSAVGDFDRSHRRMIRDMKRGSAALLAAIKREHPRRFMIPFSVPRVATGMAA